MWTSIRQLLFLISLFVAAINAKNTKIHLPSIDFQERNLSGEDLKDDGKRIGAFVVKNLGKDYKTSAENFYAKAPSCIGKMTELPTLGILGTFHILRKKNSGWGCLEILIIAYILAWVV